VGLELLDWLSPEPNLTFGWQKSLRSRLMKNPFINLHNVIEVVAAKGPDLYFFQIHNSSFSYLSAAGVKLTICPFRS
jgi:hypothetical protein